jgi:hypothetical protein
MWGDVFFRVHWGGFRFIRSEVRHERLKREPDHYVIRYCDVGNPFVWRYLDDFTYDASRSHNFITGLKSANILPMFLEFSLPREQIKRPVKSDCEQGSQDEGSEVLHD